MCVCLHTVERWPCCVMISVGTRLIEPGFPGSDRHSQWNMVTGWLTKPAAWSTKRQAVTTALTDTKRGCMRKRLRCACVKIRAPPLPGRCKTVALRHIPSLQCNWPTELWKMILVYDAFWHFPPSMKITFSQPVKVFHTSHFPSVHTCTFSVCAAETWGRWRKWAKPWQVGK